MKNSGIWIYASVWRKILKEKLGYSFKKWSPRPLSLNRKNQELKKILFSVKLLKMIKRSTLLINIDETVISYSTKSNYSWCPKGISTNLSTIIIMKGSISVVSAIWSNGISITAIRNGTIASTSFVEYIDHMLTVCSRLGFERKMIYLIMDNSPIHWSRKVQTHLKERNLYGILLPQYCPELTPVELFFGILKKLIWSRRTCLVINLEKDSGRKVIEDIIRSIDRTTVIKIWGYFISELKQIVSRIGNFWSS